MFYVNTCIRKVSAVLSVLVSLIPLRLSPLEQPLFRAENSHVAGRCSDYCFFIDHDGPRVSCPFMGSYLASRTELYTYLRILNIKGMIESGDRILQKLERKLLVFDVM